MEEEKKVISDGNNLQKQNASKGNLPIITILLVVIVLALSGYIIYDKVVKKEDKPKENNIEEKEKNEEKQQEQKEPTIGFNINDLAGKTFKTTNGKKVLKIVSKEDGDALKKAKQYGILDASYEYAYFGYYNDKFFVIYNDGESNKNEANSKYIVLGGTKEGNYPQCRDTHEFVIKTTGDTLLD